MNLKRQLRGSETGADVRMVQRALNRWSSQAVPIPTDGKYGQRTSDRMIAFQLAEKIRPARGDFGQASLDKLWPHFDRYGRYRYRLYRPPRPKPVLVEPNQGFASLDRSLWEVYAIGRKADLSDLGTYNPASNLPSGRPSDHAVYPAMAFDLGIEPDTGWQNLKARTVALRIVRSPAVEYVILGDRIWTDWRKFWGAYYSGGHLNHMHVSGRR